MDESNLTMKYVVLKVEDINSELDIEEQKDIDYAYKCNKKVYYLTLTQMFQKLNNGEMGF
jgi:hypothetical protein